MEVSLCGCAPQCAQVHGDGKRILPAHGVNEERQATAAIGALAQRAIDLAGGDHRLGIGGAHPVHGTPDILVGDGHAVTDDHRTFLLQ